MQGLQVRSNRQFGWLFLQCTELSNSTGRNGKLRLDDVLIFLPISIHESLLFEVLHIGTVYIMGLIFYVLSW